MNRGSKDMIKFIYKPFSAHFNYTNKIRKVLVKRC